MASLLALDVGLRAGLALYADDGRLVWYRSQNFGNPARLKRAAHVVLRDLPELRWLVVEGSGPLAEPWAREASRCGAELKLISAETWRQRLLYPREQRDGRHAKRTAGDLARAIIEWAGAKRPTSLRHDAAEAILIGLWGVLEVGWLEALPWDVRRTVG